MEITCRNHPIIARSHHIYMVLFFAHILFVMNRAFSATPAERLQQHPLLFATNRTDRTFFSLRFSHSMTFASWSQHHFCCDQKAQPVCAQSCALWQQATIEITCRDHSVIAITLSLFAPHIYGVVLRTHSVRDELSIQRNASREVATLMCSFAKT